MGGTDKTIDILKIMRGPKTPSGARVVRISTTDPYPITLVFEGTPLPLDLEIFEMPTSFYPLRKNDRFLVMPIVGDGQRWGVITKITGDVVTATMTGATSCQVQGIDRPYTAQDLILPQGQLQYGDRVILLPTVDNGKIKYLVQRY